MAGLASGPSATLSSRQRVAAAPAPIQNQTQTQTQTQTTTQPVLHLRGAVRTPGERVLSGGERRIQWAEDVVDNEGLGRKSSKVCCIYHAPKGIDESSDESSDDSSSDESGDDGSARPVGGKRARGHKHGHGHGHDAEGGKGKSKGRGRSPNAYEKMPRVKDGGAKRQER